MPAFLSCVFLPSTAQASILPDGAHPPAHVGVMATTAATTPSLPQSLPSAALHTHAPAPTAPDAPPPVVEPLIMMPLQMPVQPLQPLQMQMQPSGSLPSGGLHTLLQSPSPPLLGGVGGESDDGGVSASLARVLSDGVPPVDGPTAQSSGSLADLLGS